MAPGVDVLLDNHVTCDHLHSAGTCSLDSNIAAGLVPSSSFCVFLHVAGSNFCVFHSAVAFFC